MASRKLQSLQFHKDKLAQLCRICGQKRRDMSSLSSKAGILKETVGIDIANDDIAIHPQKICARCRLMLGRWAKVKAKEGSATYKGSLPVVYNFEEHRQLPKCNICSRPPGRSKGALTRRKRICFREGETIPDVPHDATNIQQFPNHQMEQEDFDTSTEDLALSPWTQVRSAMEEAYLHVPTETQCCVQTCSRLMKRDFVLCEDCGPFAYYCRDCCKSVHGLRIQGNQHQRFLFHKPKLWTATGYTDYRMDILLQQPAGHDCSTKSCRSGLKIFDEKGRLHHCSLVRCQCEREECVTLMRHKLWSASTREPRVAFHMELMKWIQFLMTETGLSLQSVCLAISWKNDFGVDEFQTLYNHLVGEPLEEFLLFKSKLCEENSSMTVDAETTACQTDSDTSNEESAVKLQNKTIKLEPTDVIGDACNQEIPSLVPSVTEGERQPQVISEEQRAVLKTHYNNGLKQYGTAEKQEQIRQVAQETGLGERTIKNLINAENKKERQAQGLWTRKKSLSLNPRRVSAQKMFMAEFMKQAGMKTPAERKEVMAQAPAVWAKIQSEEPGALAKYQEMADKRNEEISRRSTLTSSSAQKKALARKTTQKIGEMCNNLEVLTDFPSVFMSSYKTNGVTYAGSRYEADKNMVRTQLKQDVTELFNLRYKQATGKNHVEYDKIFSGMGTHQIEGLPTGIIFNKPGSYGVVKLKKILEAKDDIRFVAKYLADMTAESAGTAAGLADTTAESDLTSASADTTAEVADTTLELADTSARLSYTAIKTELITEPTINETMESGDIAVESKATIISTIPDTAD